MAINEIHVGDVDTLFRLTIKTNAGTVADLSTATSLTIKFSLHDGTTISRTATFSTDGTDGKIQYLTVAGDLSVPGSMRYQAIAEFGAAKPRHSDIVTRNVHANL